MSSEQTRKDFERIASDWFLMDADQYRMGDTYSIPKLAKAYTWFLLGSNTQIINSSESHATPKSDRRFNN